MRLGINNNTENRVFKWIGRRLVRYIGNDLDYPEYVHEVRTGILLQFVVETTNSIRGIMLKDDGTLESVFIDDLILVENPIGSQVCSQD
jgi:hypothetical protein